MSPAPAKPREEKHCPACSHPERATLDNALRAGQAPRSVVRRYSGLGRKALARHRDRCLAGAGEGRGGHS